MRPCRQWFQCLFVSSALLAASCGYSATAGNETLPYNTEAALAPLTFDQPVAVVVPPGASDELFVVEKPGRIVRVTRLEAPTRSIFLDLTDRIGDASGERGLLALAFHPNYAENHQFYVWYTSTSRGRSEERLSRFQTFAEDPTRADPNSEERLISQLDEAPNHNGGQLLFGPDGYLYVSIGDEGGANDSLQNSQRIDKDFFSGILRIDVDRRPENPAPNPHPSVHPGTYSVPRDNPFIAATSFAGRSLDPERVRTEFWAIGLRNPWRMAFDSTTGLLWCGDVGQNAFEEIDVIVRGSNYGWNYREGNHPGPRGGPPASLPFVSPVWDYPRSQGNSVTGGFVYHGDRYPDLEGRYLFGDYGSGRIWALTPDGTNPVTSDRIRQIAQVPQVVSFGLDPRTGDILIVTLSGNRLLRLVPLKE